MNWKKLTNQFSLKCTEIPLLDFTELRKELIEKINNQEKRILSYFAVPREDHTRLYVLLGDDSVSQLYLSSAAFDRSENSYPSLTPVIPSLHLFEREWYEETGIEPLGHPWLKPVRYSKERHDLNLVPENYPFYSMKGEEIHEVAVGPVHAGVIEPGHFRFQCHGEKIYHLEIQLGYQHRGFEKLIKTKMNSSPDASVRFVPVFAEKIAGDSAIAHCSAYAGIMEAFLDTDIPFKAKLIRAIALELERAAVHMGDLGAVLNDVGFMMGAATFGAERTLIINSLLRICGSRFGMGLIKVGGVHFDISPELADFLKKTLDRVEKKLEHYIHLNLLQQPSVLTRLEGTGTVSYETARTIGMVGPAARASGVETDVRTDYPFDCYRLFPSRKIALQAGDVFSRTYIRYVEILQSFQYIREKLEMLENEEISLSPANNLPPDSFAVSMTEGWRGEIVHCAVTDAKGKILRYKIKDPSFNNWYGLALAVRNNGISDFPLCNKSFNLSYCGHDL